jgi:hypothetical protein
MSISQAIRRTVFHTNTSLPLLRACAAAAAAAAAAAEPEHQH